MNRSLVTLRQQCRHQEEIRKSRFVATAVPVESVEQALAFLHDVADSDATHNGWAYRIGSDYRFNDDGEPGGSAGRPILQAIEGQSMDRIAVMVTRWYGGIKLGVGGLARAYGGTAAECLRRAERVPIVRMATLSLRCDFATLALLKSRLHELHADIASEDFDADGARLKLLLPAERVAEAQRRIGDISRGRSEVHRLD